MTNPNLHIIDDGTLDTIVACAGCDWEGRYNIEPENQEDEDWRIHGALEIASEDHDCGVPDGPLN